MKPQNYSYTENFESLHSDPAKSSTLPGFFYHSADIFELEKERIFYNSWQVVAHVSQLELPGDFVCFQIVDENVFVIRGEDGIIRGFYNVCQHRAHQLLEGQGHLNSAIICPYHNWIYDLEGGLNKVRYCNKQANFNKANYGLAPIQVEEILGFIFVNLERTAPPLKSIAGKMFEDIEAKMPCWNEMVISPEVNSQSSDASTLNANWKVLAENSLENYHVGPIHPAYVDMVDLDTYDWEICELWIKGSGKIKNPNNDAYNIDPSELCQEAITWRLWPNIAFLILPGEASSFSVVSSYPVTPSITRRVTITLVQPGETVNFNRWNYLWNTIWTEDKSVCESVHKGLRSRGYRQGRFMINPDLPYISEYGPHFFQLLYAKAMEL